MTAQLVEKVRALVVPAVEAAGYEVVDIEWKHEQVGWILRLYIDHVPGSASGVTGGVGLDDCERVSREVSALLDVHDAIPQHYSLEVSSPGLNRPLRTADHFRRHVGQRARIRLRAGVDGRRNFTGSIIAVDDAGATVKIEVDDGREYDLPLADLDKANLEYAFTNKKHEG